MYVIYTDGLCQPNPGQATWAFLVEENGKEIFQQFGALEGIKTNNDAEYIGFGKALAWLAKENKTHAVVIRSDSKLVLNQISGEFACNKEHLIVYRDRCRELIKQIETRRGLLFEWISGDANPADELTRIAYKKHTGKTAFNPHKKQLSLLS